MSAKRFIFTMPDELHEIIRKKAFDERKSMSLIIIEAINAYLKNLENQNDKKGD